MKAGTLFAFAPFVVHHVLGKSIQPRADESLYNPDSGHPQASDVIDFVQSGSDDSFDNTFSVILYAVANQKGHIDKLFKDQGNGNFEFTFYDPVTHEPTSHPVSLAESTDHRGGADRDAFKNRWWVAAAFKVLKSEWDASYEPPLGLDAVKYLNPTERGKPFEDALRARYSDMMLAPLNIGDVDLRAGLWLMNVLMRRNVVWSIVLAYRTQKDSSYAFTSDSIRDIVNQPPSIWIGFTNAGDTDSDNNYKAYSMDSIEYRERSDIIVSRPDAGRKATETIDLSADEDSFHAILIRLEDLTEKWDADKWYERADAPALTEPLSET